MGHDETTRPGGAGRDGVALGHGEKFAGLRIDCVAGRGGSGIVYRAWDSELDQPRALKVLFADLARGEAFRRRFERETRAIASLEHPSVVRVHRAGEHHGHLFLSMQFVDGETLADLLGREGSLDIDRTVAILGKVASALDAAHAAGIVHRDVKPANILVADDDVFLTDFGIAKHTAGAEPLTEPGELIGTANYVAPEQVSGDEVGSPADVYALGCVAYECLTGQPPFKRTTRLATLVAHTVDPRPRGTLTQPETADVLERALAVEPAQRYASATELVVALAGNGNSHAPTERRSVRGIMLAGLAVIFVAAAVLVFALGGDDSGDRVVPAGSPQAAAADPGGEVVRAPALPHEAGAITVGNLKVWTTGGASISGIEPADGEVDPTIDRAGSEVGKVAVGFGSVWALDRGGSLLRFDPDTSAEPIDIPLGAQPEDLAITTSAIWVALRDGNVARISPANEVVARVPIGGLPVALAADQPRLWVAATQREAGAVFAIDTRTNEVETVVNADDPVDLTVSEEAVWFLEESGDILGIDRVNQEMMGDPVASEPGAVALTSGFGSLWLADPENGAVTRVDPDGAVEWRPVRARGATDVASGPESIWVAQGREERVSEIEPRSKRVSRLRTP